MAHILIVESDSFVAEHAARVLIDAGHACGWLNDAESASKVLARKRPDLMLVAEHLPGESGSTFLRRLRQSAEFCDLPIIILTTNPGFKEEQIAYYNGAQDYFRKPLGERMLQYRVNQLLTECANGRHQPPGAPSASPDAPVSGQADLHKSAQRFC